MSNNNNNNMSIPSKMKSWTYTTTSPGGLEKNLHFNPSTNLPPSSKNLKQNDLLIKVITAALNPVDYKLAELPYIGKFIVGPRPAIPGMDFSGQVISIGSGIKDKGEGNLKVGDLVFGKLAKPIQYGTLGEYIVCSRAGITKLPSGVDVNQAAGVGVGALTAYQSIVPYIREGEGKGKNVFINGGSGGTGTFGIQIAKVLGCHVVTTCSSANVDLCKELGADEVIDYKTTDVLETLKKSGRKFDLVVDNIGNSAAMYWIAHHYTTPQASYIQVGVEVSLGSVLDLLKKSMWPGILGGGKRKYVGLQVVDNPEQYAHIAQWMKEGKVRTIVDQVFAFENAPQAFEKLKTNRAKGKVLIKISSDS